MPLLGRKRVLLAKIETTYGTDPTPTGAANAILVSNMSITPQDADFAARDLVRPFLGIDERLPAGIRAMVEFEVELQASGTAGTAPAWGPLMRACAMSETIAASVSATYTPISATFESVTLYFNVDGVLHKLTGGRGTWSLNMKVKEIPKLKFSITGIYNAVTDTAAPTPTYTPWKQPLPVTNLNTTPFTLFGVSPVMSDLSVDLAASIVHRTLVGGAEAVLFTDREPTGSVTIEATTVAFKDWWAVAKAATLGALSITHGTVAGSKVTFQAPNVQLTKPNYSDMDGVQMLQLGLNLMPNAGNDEFTFVCT